jgi:outer membrane protein insertion porin family
VKRALVFIALLACGPSTPASHTIAEKTAHPAFACPATPPVVKADPAAIAPLVGQPVVHVCVIGGSNEARVTTSAALGTKTGAPLDMKRVRADLAAVMDLPMIDDVTASATRDAAGLTVFYAIRERPVIASLDFEGVHAFTRSEIEAAPIAEGQHLDPRALRAFTRAFAEAYDERGYGSAKVDYGVKLAEPTRARVTITVREGMPWRFGAITFQGNKVLAQADLAKAIEIHTGEQWSADRLARCEVVVQALAYDRGLVESSVKVEHGMADPTSGAVPVTVTIREGDVYVVRKISVSGVAPAVEKQALAAMKAKPKSVFSRSVLGADIVAMRTALGMEIEPQTTVDPKTKSIDLVLVATKKSP